MSTMRELLNTLEDLGSEPRVGDILELECGDVLIEATITECGEDGIGIVLDETALELMIDSKRRLIESTTKPTRSQEELAKLSKDLHDKWKDASSEQERAKIDAEIQALHASVRRGGTHMLVPEDSLEEAEYQGRTVQLGKPMAGEVKKSKVYVRGPKGNVVKVNFGQKGVKIKKNNPARRKSFRARHNCDNPGPRWKARYWSCRAW